MSHEESIEMKKKITGYVSGLVLSLACTLIAYWMVSTHVNGAHMTFSHTILIVMLGILAISQFIVQLVYFLHLGTESRPRWKQLVFWFMIIIVLIIVGGSIWIMDNLNYNMMSNPDAGQKYIDKNQGF